MFYTFYLLALGFGSVFTVLSLFSVFSTGSTILAVEHESAASGEVEHEVTEGGGDTEVGEGFALESELRFFEPSEIDPSMLPEVVRHNLSVVGKVVPHVRPYRPFRQFRFYTAWAQFFGLTGFILSLLAVAEWPTFGIALAIGCFAGFIVTYALYAVDRYGGAKITTLNDMIGHTGLLTVPVALGKVGSIQLTLESGTKELICKTHEEKMLLWVRSDLSS